MVSWKKEIVVFLVLFIFIDMNTWYCFDGSEKLYFLFLSYHIMAIQAYFEKMKRIIDSDFSKRLVVLSYKDFLRLFLRLSL